MPKQKRYDPNNPNNVWYADVPESEYAYTPDAKVYEMGESPDGVQRDITKPIPVKTPDDGWVAENPEAVAEGDNEMLAPYVDESEPTPSVAEADPPENPKQLLDSIDKADVALALANIKDALKVAESGIQDGSVTEANVIRVALMRSNVFGDKTAQIVSDMQDDDEVVSLFQHAQGSQAPPAPAPQNQQPPTPVQVGPVAPVAPPTPPVSPSGSPAPGSTPPTAPGVPSVSPTPGTPTPPVPTPPTPPTPPGTPTRTPAPGTPPVSPPNPVPTPPGSRSNSPPPTPNALQAQLDLDKKLDRLDEVRTTWAKISAKRHRRPITGFFIKHSRAYKEAEENYKNLSRETTKLELASALAAETDPLQKRAMVDLHWINEQNQLREEATKFVEDRVWWKVVNGVSNFMNKGNLGVRIAKRATLGIVAGAAGALTFGAGTAGAAAALMAFRFGNSQTSKVTGGIGQLSDKQKTDLSAQRVLRTIRDDDTILANRADAFENVYEKDSKKQRRKRLGALAISAATAAAGYTAGEAIHHLADSWLHNPTDVTTGGNTPAIDNPPADTPPAIDNPPDTGAGHGDLPNSSGDGHGASGYEAGGTDSAQAATEVPAPTGHDLINSIGAYHVDAGEGWYETFQDMGIPKDNWEDVLQDAGPKLRDMGVAYFDNAQGQWAISQPGNLSGQALQTVADSSAKFGYAFNKIV